MARLILYTLLFLAIQLKYFVSPKVHGPLMKIGAHPGNTYSFSAANLGSNADKCIAVHGDKSYVFYPEVDDKRISHKITAGKVTCEFDLIDVQPEDAGEWRILYFEATKNGKGLYEPMPEINIYDFEVFGENKKTTTTEESEIIETVPEELKTQLNREQDKKAERPVTQLKKYIGNHVSFGLYERYEKIISCTATNNGQSYEIYPEMTLPNAIFRGQTSCMFEINPVEWSHAGLWTVTSRVIMKERSSITSDSIEQELEKIDNYELYLFETVKTKPARQIIMNSGYAIFYMSEIFDSATSCQLTNRNDDSYDLLNAIDENKGIERYGTCGARIRITETSPRDWSLSQKQGEYKEKIATFSIQTSSDKTAGSTHYLYWQRGAEASIKNIRSTYCEIIKPDGTVVVLTSNECNYGLDVVTDKHAGVWKLRYGVNHKMNLIEDLYIVEVWNPDAVDMSISTEEGQIRMLCKSGLRSLNSCSFESPNGTVFSLKPAMGDGKYEYYGNGIAETDEPKRAECGLLVRNPSNDDYGRWKCSMRSKQDILSGILNVKNPSERNIDTPFVTPSEVYVKRGNKFTIKCSVDVPINYCWMRSPNGTHYSVAKNGKSENSLSYNGDGLLLGVCGAVVENADDTDNGDWSCRLGVVGGKEIESIVPVTVTESELIPGAKEISTYPGSKTIFTCRTFPSSEATIDYCRWLKPNGEGLQDESLTNKNNCSLKYDITAEDFGTWTCFARLSAATDDEVRANFEVQSERIQFKQTNSTFSTVAIALLCTSLIAGCILAVAFYRMRSRRNHLPTSQPQPPPYEFDREHVKDSQLPRSVPFFPFDPVEKSFKQ